jgi:Sigma-70 region 2
MANINGPAHHRQTPWSNGGRTAFEEFYREHFDLVLRFVTRRVGDADTAADLTAEVFLAALDGASAEPDATVSLRLRDAEDPTALEQSLREAGVPAVVRIVGSSCLGWADPVLSDASHAFRFVPEESVDELTVLRFDPQRLPRRANAGDPDRPRTRQRRPPGKDRPNVGPLRHHASTMPVDTTRQPRAGPDSDARSFADPRPNSDPGTNGKPGTDGKPHACPTRQLIGARAAPRPIRVRVRRRGLSTCGCDKTSPGGCRRGLAGPRGRSTDPGDADTPQPSTSGDA